MKRFIIILLIGLLLLGLGIAVCSKYVPILTRDVVYYCEECYGGEDDAEHVIWDEGIVQCECGRFLGDHDSGDVYTNKFLIQEDWNRYGDLMHGSVYCAIFGAIITLLGVLDGLRDWSEKNGS